MSRPGRPRRRWRLAVAAALVTGLPLAAFELAPQARADDSPGANLAGLNAFATSTGMQISPLTPGLVGAGDVSQGNLFEVAAPFASATTATGPSSQGIGAPAYPGPTAAGAGNAIATFSSQFPPQMVYLLNDHELAQADYPPQQSAGSSASYAPPGGAATGAGTASATAADHGAVADGAANQTTAPGGAVVIGSSTSHAETVLTASTVTATSHTLVGPITIGGTVQIAGVKSDASAASDGTTGTPTGDFQMGAVTVAGQPAYIDSDGIHLKSSSVPSPLAGAANQALVALQQSGISIRTIAPTKNVNGHQADFTSGALQITFADHNIPNPNGQVPISAAGLNMYIGLAQASADATGLPPLGDLGGLASIGGTPASGGTGGVTSAPAVTPGAALTGGSTPASVTGGSVGTPSEPVAIASSPATNGSTSGGSLNLGPPVHQAVFMGLPVRLSWVILALILSIIASGPLLGYANWQLLRGRRA